MLSCLSQPQGLQGVMVGQEERFKCLTGVVFNCTEIELITRWLGLYLAHLLFLIFLPFHAMPSNAFMLSSLEVLQDDHRP